jgi:hypothetical protein
MCSHETGNKHSSKDNHHSEHVHCRWLGERVQPLWKRMRENSTAKERPQRIGGRDSSRYLYTQDHSSLFPSHKMESMLNHHQMYAWPAVVVYL